MLFLNCGCNNDGEGLILPSKWLLSLSVCGQLFKFNYFRAELSVANGKFLLAAFHSMTLLPIPCYFGVFIFLSDLPRATLVILQAFQLSLSPTMPGTLENILKIKILTFNIFTWSYDTSAQCTVLDSKQGQNNIGIFSFPRILAYRSVLQ